tara:strand:- start:288 stop:1406 length:1119 start_codon:yes stop_codon:yes gene_type:complete
MTKKILLLPGDGIGHEISKEAEKIFNWLDQNTDLEFEISKEHIGGASIDQYGEPITNKVLKLAQDSDAILLGAVGGPKWEKLDFSKRPERGLLKIRKELDLFANFRPALVFDALVSASSLKAEIILNLDIMIIRELTSGIYFGEPRGVEKISENIKKGFNTLVYHSDEIERIATVGFELAMKRDKKLCSVDKANVLESTELWRDVVNDVSKKFPKIELTHMYVDNAAMQLVRNPKQFDVIVTTNMFGDILSDCASMLTGSLGMLPSASLGEFNTKRKMRKAMYEPVHGSAPDIAGKNLANPLAMIQSIGMMLEYSFNSLALNDLIKNCINKILNKGYRTQDIFNNSNEKKLTTSEMGDILIKELESCKNEKN